MPDQTLGKNTDDTSYGTDVSGNIDIMIIKFHMSMVMS